MRIRWMSLLLGLALLQGGVVGAAWGQTTIERSRDIEINNDANLPDFEGNPVSQEDIGEESNPDGEQESTELTESSAADDTIEFTPSESASSSTPRDSAIVRYNIRKNVCTGNWSMAELNSMFPGVDAELVRDVCG